MSMIVQTNLSMINTQRNYKINTGNKAKSTEKLSSGYRINRAADDAANLTISEKMRQQIRGLDRGTLNGEEGVSWIQTGDGALNEVHDMLHRMKELTIQSLNDTNTESDRAALQAEMDALQCEIDKIADSTQFNTQNIFNEHEPTYYQYEGNVVWDQGQTHVIDAGSDLKIKYTMDSTSGEEEVAITVPAGEYTTQELTDEIEDALIAAGAGDKGIFVEFTDAGTFNVNLEGGEKIETVTGELAYLLYDTYEGGSAGALVGTTVFSDDTKKLPITSENNNLIFDIEYFDGTQNSVNLTIPNGSYTRPEIIDLLNQALAGTQVEAVSAGTGIKLQSNEAIITGFKGNMFKIDGGTKPSTSIFYDNVKYGSISMTAGSFTGGSVIPENSLDVEHHKFTIDSTNNQLTFTANDSTTPVTITIDDGEYTLDQMVTKLNSLFTANGLELNAIVNDTGSFRGIKITSSVKGAVSKVGLDSSSSAYNTLFVERVYNDYRNLATLDNETSVNKDATFTGSKAFDGSNPLTIVTGTNDQFKLKIGSSEYTITLSAGTYNTAADLQTEIDNRLNGTNAASGYKGLVEVSVVDGKIKLTADSDTTIKSLTSTTSASTLSVSATAISGNSGYDNIFVGKKETVKYSSVSNTGNPPVITLNNPITDPATITDADKNITVNVNGTNKVVTLPTGSNVTHQQIMDAINDQLKEVTTTTNNTFAQVNGKGTTTSNAFNYSGTSGKTNVSSKTYNDTGYSTLVEGQVGTFDTNEPAQVEMDVALPASMTIDSTNNSLQITINGETKNLALDAGTYTRAQLVNQLQSKIDTAFTKDAGKGAVVSLSSDNELVVTARIDGNTDGGSTNISFDTGTSTFIKALKTTKTNGYVTSDAMASSITIDDSSNQFSFAYTEDGVAKTANITLDNGTYTRDTFVSMLNRKLDAAGVNITASKYGNDLRLTTDTAGTGNSVSINTSTVGNSVEAVFGPMQTNTAATGVANQTVQDSVTIDGTSNVFNVTVNGTSYSLTLDDGTYTRQGIVDEINEKLAAENAGLTASLEGNRIRYTTDAVGSSASFVVNYNSGGSAMKAIYGTTTTTSPGVTASFDSNNQLVLTGTQNGTSLSVNSNSGSILQEPTIEVSDISVSTVTGYYSKDHSYIDGVNITAPVEVNQWSNELSFNYIANGTTTPVAITVPDASYDFATLQSTLQTAIDNAVGTDQLEVTVSSTGVRIQAKNSGSNYSLSGFSGDFFEKVMDGTTEKKVNQSTSTDNGTAPKDTAYTIGRKDVRNQAVEIKSGVNDTLSLDFQYGTNSTTFDITLDPGTYQGESLRDAVQEKLNEAMVAQGFAENMIVVGIGGITSGVTGANDANALNFQLSTSVRLPEEGTYIIDGVSGNAAFSIFYQTDGELIPAYVKGAKDLSESVTIEDGANELSFDVDGVTYPLTIPAKEYTADEIIAEINSQLNSSGAPVIAELDEGALKLSYVKLGTHKINNIVGNGKQVLFFSENGEIGEGNDVNIQLSSRKDDSTVIDRPVLNTVSLGINSVAITAPKYANKALERLEEALAKVSAIRSNFGASQNRLQHAIANNKNTSENTQAAESRIRDTDMAETMVENSRNSILMQAGEAIMAQTMSNAEGVLRLLQV